MATHDTASTPQSPPTPPPWTPPAPLPRECTTPRLVLRFWRPEDAPGMLEALNVDRASFLPWLSVFGIDNRTVPECVYHIERFRRDAERTEPPADDFKIGIFDRSTGAAIGGTGLHRISAKWHEAEIGYWVRPDRRGQGLCGEAVEGLISWALAAQTEGGWGLRRLHIRCAASNAASQRVPRKLGLREEARLVQERWVEGIGWDDTLVWGVVAGEWESERAMNA